MSFFFISLLLQKKKKWRKNLGVETTKKFIHSVNSSQVREWGKIQAFFAVNCCQNLYKVKKRKVILFQ